MYEEEIQYKYINFVKIDLRGKIKTSIWSCRNNKSGTELGQVKWYPPWRQYCYFPTIKATYNIECLNNIINFINHKMRSHHEDKKA